MILESHGFSDLLEQVSFLQRIGHQDAQVVGDDAHRARGRRPPGHALAALEQRDRTLTDQVLAQRNQVAALHAALLNRQIAELGARSSATTKLHG